MDYFWHRWADFGYIWLKLCQTGRHCDADAQGYRRQNASISHVLKVISSSFYHFGQWWTLSLIFTAVFDGQSQVTVSHRGFYLVRSYVECKKNSSDSEREDLASQCQKGMLKTSNIFSTSATTRKRGTAVDSMRLEGSSERSCCDGHVRAHHITPLSLPNLTSSAVNTHIVD